MKKLEPEVKYTKLAEDLQKLEAESLRPKKHRQKNEEKMPDTSMSDVRQTSNKKKKEPQGTAQI